MIKGSIRGLRDGTDTFTAIAHDGYGRGDTNTSVCYLAASIYFAYDPNGNLITNGPEGLVYDDEDDEDRERLLQTLTEAFTKTAWQVHAHCLMRNHSHLVIEPPQPNLVAGTKWLVDTYTPAREPQLGGGTPSPTRRRDAHGSLPLALCGVSVEHICVLPGCPIRG